MIAVRLTMSRRVTCLLGAVCFATAATIRSAEPTPPAVDAFGVISIEAEDAIAVAGWQETAYYTGIALRAVGGSDDAAPPFADYRIEIRTPGAFVVHLLGNRRPNSETSDHVVGLAVAAEGEPFGPIVRLQFLDLNAPAWTTRPADGNVAPMLRFSRPGRYRLRLTAEKGHGCLVDKIVLSASGYVPTGIGPAGGERGYASSRSAGFDPGVVLPPRWAFGVLYGGYTNQQRSLEVVDRLIEGNFPIDAYWVDSWFWDFVNEGRGPGGYLRFEPDPVAFPDVGAMWQAFQERHVKAGVWIWDCLLREGNEATFDEFMRAGALSEPFIERNGWHNRTRLTISANIAFDQPEAVALWRARMKPLFDAGLDFLKLDRSSAIPFCRTAFEATQQLGHETGGRGFILAHLHSTYDQRHKLYPTKWSGDAKITWSQPDYPDLSQYAMGGLRENIGMVADPKRSTYEVPFLAHDAGGYDTFGGDEGTDELYVRWIEFAALNSVMTVFTHQSSPTGHLPFNYSPAVQDIFRRYTHLRMRLFPYLYTYALNTRLTGIKMVRGDREHEDQYQLGEELLVAPVHVPGATTRAVFLPAGRWFEWGSDRAWEGGCRVVVDAPLEKLPLFVREGAIVPLRDYARSVEQGSNDRLTLEVFPAAAPSRFLLREDDGVSNDYLDGAIAVTAIERRPDEKDVVLTIRPVEGSYRGMPAARQWVIRFHAMGQPRGIRVNGEIAEYSYDSTTRISTVLFSAPRNRETSVAVGMQD